MKKLYLLLIGLVLIIVPVSCAYMANEPAAEGVRSDQSVSDAIRNGAVVIDVRTSEEVAGGYFEGALHIPHDQIAERLGEIPAEQKETIVVYCQSGRRAGMAAETLASHGFTSVLNAGGFADIQSMARTE